MNDDKKESKNTMKKYLILFLFIFISWLFSAPPSALAEESPVTSEQINARILPLIWYSALSINEGGHIKIYAGIQNNSGIDFTGTAFFYIDDKKISDSQFSSLNDSLKDISADWVAEAGSHDIQVKIATSLPSDKSLVSYESAKSNITVVKKITRELIEDTIIKVVSNVVSKIDEAAVPLINKIEDLKKPVSAVPVAANQKTKSQNSSQKDSGTVIGVINGLVSGTSTNGIAPMASVFNSGVDSLTFLVKNWLWTLGGIILLFLIIKIRRWGKR